jgi:hypothetical protein
MSSNPMMKRLFWIVLITSSALLTPVVPAQTFDATKIGDSVPLTGNLRMQTGDDMAWADPGFDDSQWKLLAADKTLADYGLRNYHGMLWYRVKIQLAPNHGPVSIRLADTFSSYQVFANGRQVAEYGGIPPHGVRYNSAPQTFSLQAPSEATAVVLAIRVWANTITATPGLSANGILIGTAPAIQKEQKLIQAQNVYDYAPPAIDAAVTFLFGVLLLLLYLAQRDHLEYFWLGAANVFGAMGNGLGMIQGAGYLPVVWQYRVGIPIQVIAVVLQIEFLFSFVGVKPNRWVRAFQAFILLFGFSFIVTYGYMNPAVNAFTQSIVAILVGSLGLLFTLLLAVWFIRGNREAGLLLIPTAISNAASFIDVVSSLAFFLHLKKDPSSVLPLIHFGPVAVAVGTLIDLPYYMVILLIIGLRFVRVSRERERAAAELEAAKGVQSLMIPNTSIETPGYSVQSAYLPAREVGGDFFYLSPTANGGLLVVIGDVVGKGMQAAMTVSMIVGALRHGRTNHPVQVLEELNQVLLDQGHSALTTCICAHFSPNQTITIANAGHPSPYRNDEELPIAGGLPLGVMAEVEYVDQSFALDSADRLLFVSDGVIEARNNQGELYGFDRFLAGLSKVHSPNEIARIAQDFGQEDDITVVAVELVPIAALA